MASLNLQVATLLCLCGWISVSLSDAQTPPPAEFSCPEVPEGTVGSCVRECDNDANCTSSLKCCPNGCGTTCVPGVSDADLSRIVWTEVFISERKSRINSLPANPQEYIGNETISTKFRYQLTEHNYLALASDYAEGMIFFSDGISKRIYAGSLLANASANTIYKGTSQTVEGIAVDWIAKNVYWCDAGYDWIMIASYSGDNSRVIIDTGLDKPRDIVVYPQKGTMYWTDWGTNATSISTATLGGEGVSLLVASNLHYPNGLTIDYTSDIIYWVDANPAGSRLESVNLDGTNRRLVYLYQGQAHFFDVTTFQNYVFMTDWFGNLQSVNKSSGEPIFSLALDTRPHSIMTYGPGLQPAYSTSPCVPNPCDQLCVHNSETEYKCVCGHGFQAVANGSCIPEEGVLVKPKILLLSKTKLCYYPANFPDVTFPDGYEPPCLFRNRTHSVALAVDVRANWVFFSDFQWKRLYRVRLRKSATIEQISGAIGSVEGMAVDYINQNLYWTDYKKNHIIVSRYDGSHRITLVDQDILKPRNLVIHMETRVMFWTEFGPPYEIEQADLDGKNRRVVATLASSPSGLAYDYVTGRLVFGETGSGTIYSYHIASQVHSRLHTRFKLIPFYDMEIFGDYLIWTEWQAANGIHALNLETGSVHQSQIVGEPVYGVRVYADIKQRANGTSGDCGDDNGGCSQLCLGTAAGHECRCTTGFRLDADGRTCLTGDIMLDRFALVTDSYEKTVFQIDLTSDSHNYTGISLGGLKNPIAIDYDPTTRKMYLSDVIGRKIIRADITGSNMEVLASENVLVPDGLAVDYLSGLLYWTDAGTNTISVARLDGNHRKTLIKDNLDQPRAIVLDPIRSVMFWSDWGSQPKIEKSSMDGKDRVTIVSTDITWTNGLALDRTASRLYWCDAKTDKIESCEFDGSDRRLFLDLGLVHPFGLAIYEDFIYWTEWTRRGLMRANKTAPSNETLATPIGSEVFLRLNGITVFSQSDQLDAATQCSTNNGECGQLCLPSPQGRTCQCEDGSGLLEDGLNCHETDNLCPMLVPNGAFPYYCDRHPGAQCSVVCETGFYAAHTNFTCEEGPEWNFPEAYICRATECPFLRSPPNAEVNDCIPPHRYDTTCSFRCSEGFTYHNGSNDRTCREDGTWSGAELTCKPIKCAPLSRPDMGMFQPDTCMQEEAAIDTECRLFCSQGYQARGPTVMTCLSTGQWSADESASACYDFTRPRFNTSCPAPMINVTAPEGQTVYPYTGTDLGATDNSGEVTVTYNLPPEPIVSLTEGLHSFIQTATDPTGNTALCDYLVSVTVNRCPYLPIPYNSDMREGCPNHHGASCRFRCNDGFRLVGRETLTCSKSETGEFVWDGSSPHCEGVTCPAPELTEGALVEGCSAPYYPNYRCYFLCERGFEHDSGSTERICQLSSEWTGTPIRCTRKKCPSLPAIEDGSINPPECISPGIPAGEVCTYSCQEGFELEGASQRVCSIDGTWVTDDAERTCKDVSGPHFNGTCPADIIYTLEPGQTSVTANWTDPTVVDEGGRVLLISSEPPKGLSLSEGVHTFVIHAMDDSGNRGSCFFTITVKVIRCIDLLTGDALSDDCGTEVGSTCTFSCDTGYRLDGPSSRTCEWDGVSDFGSWSGREPSCEAVTCPPLVIPEGSHQRGCSIDVESVPYGFICTLFCEEGYYQEFGAEKKCSENGTWIGEDSPCTPVTCEGIYPPLNGSLSPASCRNGSRFADVCTYSCDEGFSLVGPESRTCQGDGQWDLDGQRSLCERNSTASGQSCPSNRIMTLQVTEPCKTRLTHELQHPVRVPRYVDLGEGVSNIQVLWGSSDSIVLCQIEVNVSVTRCPPLTSDLVTSLSCSNIFGSSVRFDCPRSNQRLVGSNTAACQDDGTWSSPVPTCEDVSCPALELPAGFTTASGCSGSASEHICDVTCPQNPSLQPYRVKCTLRGVWLDMQDNEFDTSNLDSDNCVDRIAPEITCPPDISLNLPSDASSMSVTLSDPNVTDNSGLVPVVTGPESPLNVPVGSQIVRYVASDASGNTATCTIMIQINDVTRPVASNCPSTVIVVPVDRITDLLLWEEPTFTDNVGVVSVRSDKSPGTPAGYFGQTTIRYVAVDAANNMGFCNITIDVAPRRTDCPALPAPVNGGKSCNSEQDRCVITCNTGYGFLPNQNLVYQCDQTLWNYELNPIIPNCGALQRNYVRLDMMSYSLESGTCSGNEDGMKEIFLQNFALSNFKGLCDSNTDLSCKVDKIQVECGDVADATRGRRMAGGGQVNITYVVQGTSNISFHALDMAYDLSVSEFFGDANTLVLEDGTTAVLVPESSQQGLLMSNCSVGSQGYLLTCISCPVGTYFRMRSQTCDKCPVGQYQDEMGTSECKRCHSGRSTPGPGAPSSASCKPQCQPGEYSYTGLQPCDLCPYGSFQHSPGSRGCNICPAGTNTTRRSSTYASACKGPTTARVPTTGRGNVVLTTQVVPAPVTTPLPPMVPPTTNEVVVMTTTKVIPTKDEGRPGKGDKMTTTKKPVVKTDSPKHEASVQKSGGGGNSWIWFIVGVSALVVLALVVILAVYIYRRRRWGGHQRLNEEGEEMEDSHEELKPDVSGTVVAFQNPAFAEVDL